MIRKLGKLFLTVCLLAVGGGVVAHAQIGGGTTIQASIPFAFTVGNATLPAGKYEIKRLDDNATEALEIRSTSGHRAVIFETENTRARDGQVASRTELVFDKFGDEYFLSQVWVAGLASGSELLKSGMEKRLAHAGSQPEKHSVAGFLKHLKP